MSDWDNDNTWGSGGAAAATGNEYNNKTDEVWNDTSNTNWDSGATEGNIPTDQGDASFGGNNEDYGSGNYETQGGQGSGERTCRNCGLPGHISRECDQPKVANENTICKKCEQTGHFSRDCPNQECLVCHNTGHKAENCPVLDEPLTRAPQEEIDQCWEEILLADKENDIDDVKSAIKEYASKDTTETWPNIEKRLREANTKIYLIAKSKILPPDKEIADLAGVGNKQYEVQIYIGARGLKQAYKDPSSEEEHAENMKKLADAGINIRLRRKKGGKLDATDAIRSTWSDKQKAYADGGCLKCGATDHTVRFCTNQGEDKQKIGVCFKCGETGHSHRSCPNPNSALFTCRNCGAEDHTSKQCPKPARCNNCQQEGHQSRDCPEPRAFTGTCKNCEQVGHRAADCPEPRKFSGTCRNCGEEGHRSSECQQPRASGNNYNQEGQHSTESQEGMKCHLCQGPHRANRCPMRSGSGDKGGRACASCGTPGHTSASCPSKSASFNDNGGSYGNSKSGGDDWGGGGGDWDSGNAKQSYGDQRNDSGNSWGKNDDKGKDPSGFSNRGSERGGRENYGSSWGSNRNDNNRAPQTQYGQQNQSGASTYNSSTNDDSVW